MPLRNLSLQSPEERGREGVHRWSQKQSGKYSHFLKKITEPCKGKQRKKDQKMSRMSSSFEPTKIFKVRKLAHICKLFLFYFSLQQEKRPRRGFVTLKIGLVQSLRIPLKVKQNFRSARWENCGFRTFCQSLIPPHRSFI